MSTVNGIFGEKIFSFNFSAAVVVNDAKHFWARTSADYIKFKAQQARKKVK